MSAKDTCCNTRNSDLFRDLKRAVTKKFQTSSDLNFWPGFSVEDSTYGVLFLLQFLGDPVPEGDEEDEVVDIDLYDPRLYNIDSNGNPIVLLDGSCPQLPKGNQTLKSILTDPLAVGIPKFPLVPIDIIQASKADGVSQQLLDDIHINDYPLNQMCNVHQKSRFAKIMTINPSRVVYCARRLMAKPLKSFSPRGRNTQGYEQKVYARKLAEMIKSCAIMVLNSLGPDSAQTEKFRKFFCENEIPMADVVFGSDNFNLLKIDSDDWVEASGSGPGQLSDDLIVLRCQIREWMLMALEISDGYIKKQKHDAWVDSLPDDKC